MTGQAPRIIAGQWRGRRLVTPSGADTRPTAARARETLFSMLVSRMGGLTGLYVADLFAGSGALGLEALSRGAAQCIFVERERAALEALHSNITAFGAGGPAVVVAGAVANAPAPAQPVDLALFDPPYAETKTATLIEAMTARGWFAPGAWLSVETGHDQSPAPAGFAVDAVRDVGKARLTLLRAPA